MEAIMQRLRAFLALVLMLPVLAFGQSGVYRFPGQIQSVDGTVGSPQYSWTSDPNTGLYRIGADNIGIAVNGTKAVDVKTTGTDIVGLLTSSSGANQSIAYGQPSVGWGYFGADATYSLLAYAGGTGATPIVGAQTFVVSQAGDLIAAASIRSPYSIFGSGSNNVNVGHIQIKQTDDTIASGIVFNPTNASVNGGIYHDGGTLGLVIRETGVNVAGFTSALAKFIKPVTITQNLSGSPSIFTIENTSTTTGSLAQITWSTQGGTFKQHSNREGTQFTWDTPTHTNVMHIRDDGGGSVVFNRPVTMAAGVSATSGYGINMIWANPTSDPQAFLGLIHTGVGGVGFGVDAGNELIVGPLSGTGNAFSSQTLNISAGRMVSNVPIVMSGHNVFTQASNYPYIGGKTGAIYVTNSATGSSFLTNGVYYDGAFKHAAANIAGASFAVLGRSSLSDTAFELRTSDSISHAAESTVTSIAIGAGTHDGRWFFGDETATNTSLTSRAYTALGGSVSGSGGSVPAFAVKKLLHTFDGASPDSVAHGLSVARIKMVQGNCSPQPSFTSKFMIDGLGDNGAQIRWDGTNVIFTYNTSLWTSGDQCEVYVFYEAS
jgi:hypothetical protein